MSYRFYFLLDLRFVRTADDVAQIRDISDVVFLLYAADLPSGLLPALQQKCRRVVCFLPLSPQTPFLSVWNAFRHR
ncbi:MAG: hypothetical protein ACI4K6_02895 [Candidatus Fimenecus sp.]